MKILLYSGLLYLAGVAIVLILQPSLMFTEQGVWKEFGIGRNPTTHTWLPFWLFVIIWALLSYIIMLLLASSLGLPGVVEEPLLPQLPQPEVQPQPNLSYHNFTTKPKGKANTLIPGYYILNREVTEATGSPKYIYLGPEPPGDINSE
uniref:Uncharacterized protein n=1 Tax=viral metagenome TaxID=1070528 RepID=A0A6C0IA09_9ZZZZ